MWTEPVLDRTQEDIANKTEKGYCNLSDRNRLERNCAHLAQLLGVSIQTREWTDADFPTVSEFARIRGNIQLLRNAFYTLHSTPATPQNPLNTWQKWNDAERILFDIKTLYDRTVQAFIYTGELYAGDEIGVI